MSQREQEPTFLSTERFTPVRLLGEGGMGVVWEAHDEERGLNVALKTIRTRDAEGLHRLKHEFRLAADLAHANLVQLYDLFVDEATCFFTMELVEGVTFIEYCRPDASPRRVRTSQAFADTAPGLAPGTSLPQYDERRLRAVLLQMVSGVAALHEAGCVHRDIKPSNVLVTAEGRLVLLDFGLALGADLDDDSFDGRIVGTVDYMAPEQAGTGEVHSASDYYSVGVMLYEALTGSVPFSGSVMEILIHKQQHPAPPPRARVPDVPEDLDALCVRLLARDSHRRPSHRAVLAALGVDFGAAAVVPSSRSLLGRVAFTGRCDELAVLDDCFKTLSDGQPSIVFIRGPSGIGKSALIDFYLSKLQVVEPACVVLEGRCYERETVPYRAVDSLIDRLAQRWMRMSLQEQRSLLPEHAEALPTLFPALGRVPAVAACAKNADMPEASDLRTIAYGALREVLSRMARSCPLVVYLDDLQWADRDSISLLVDLMRPPEPPALLLLLASRSRLSHLPFLQTSNIGLLSAMTEAGLPADMLMGELAVTPVVIDLAPLSTDDARELAALLVRGSDGPLAERVAREGGGVPFFLGELAIHIQLAPDQGTDGMSMEGVLQDRVRQLSDGARALLELVAVAGEPVSYRVAASAMDQAPADLARHIQIMRTAHLLRAPSGDAAHRVECYHDRIRETVRAMLSEARRSEIHEALAFSYERCSEGSAQQLAHHWHCAGDRERSARYALAAARDAAGMSDFDRAARLYKIALDVGSFARDEEVALRRLLGKCLAGAGQPLAAADVFRAAAKMAGPAAQLELRHAAADALLAGGHIDEGLAAIAEVLQHVGMSLARSPGAASRGAGWRRTWLRVRGLRWRARAAVDIPTRKLIECDVCGSVATALAVVDPVRAAEYQARHLLLALRLGEPERVARAMTLEAGFLAAQGHVKRSRRLIKRVETEFAELEGVAHEAHLAWSRGAGFYFCANQWRAAVSQFRKFDQQLRMSGVTVGFELETARLYQFFSLLYLGELSTLTHAVPAAVSEADRRGTPYLGVCLRLRLGRLWLARDEPERAQHEADVALRRWGNVASGYHVQHFFGMFALCEIDLYTADANAAWQRMEQGWQKLVGSPLFQVPMVRAEALHLRGRIALAQAAAASDHRAPLREVRRVLKTVAKIDVPVAGVFRALLEAGLAAIVGQDDQAVHALQMAQAKAAELEMSLHVAVSRACLGVVAHERAARSEAESLSQQWMRDQSVASPVRLVRLLVPGIASTK